MKNSILILTFIAFTSIFTSAGWSMIPSIENVVRITVKRTLPSMVQRRAMHTQLKTKGFRPEKSIETTQWHTLKLPKKLEYVDEAHETFKTPPGFIESIERSLHSRGTEQSLKLDDLLKKK